MGSSALFRAQARCGAAGHPRAQESRKRDSRPRSRTVSRVAATEFQRFAPGPRRAVPPARGRRRRSPPVTSKRS